MPETPTPPIVVLFGEESHQKQIALDRTLDQLLPPQVDRALALTTFDVEQNPDQGGPTIARVLEDLATLPFLSDRRVVIIRNADPFISAHRERLEQYLEKPSPTGVLILECRSFPKNTRLYKAANALDAELIECKKLVGRALIEFVIREARARDKHFQPAAAAQLVDLVGPESGTLAMEVEKLTLYAADRPEITTDDVADLVGLSREEKIFAAADAAALGQLPQALQLWHQVLVTDPAAVYRSIGGLAAKVRDWLNAHQLAAEGLPLAQVAPRVKMWRREQDLRNLLHRQPPRRLRQALAAIADLDSQAKSGTRSIEKGIELLLVRLATPAR
jgi:DNA polymerase-3 subunit delta